jgi:uncharacterized membrane protein YfcA
MALVVHPFRERDTPALNRRDAIAGLFGGMLTGMAGGFFGVGGGIILIPLLTGYFRATQHQAHGTSLAVIGATALVSIVVYASGGNVGWWTAVAIGLASVVTSRWGARLAARTSPGGLKRAFAVFLALVALRLMVSPPAADGIAHLHGFLAQGATIVGLGLAVGLLAGYMGVGGGILIVPALTLLLGWPQHLAQGTSLAAILLVAPIGSIEHARAGNVIGRVVPALAIGAAIGGPIASAIALHLDRVTLTRWFAAFLIANAVFTWVRAGRKPRNAD